MGTVQAYSTLINVDYESMCTHKHIICIARHVSVVCRSPVNTNVYDIVRSLEEIVGVLVHNFSDAVRSASLMHMFGQRALCTHLDSER